MIKQHLVFSFLILLFHFPFSPHHYSTPLLLLLSFPWSPCLGASLPDAGMAACAAKRHASISTPGLGTFSLGQQKSRAGDPNVEAIQSRDCSYLIGHLRALATYFSPVMSLFLFFYSQSGRYLFGFACQLLQAVSLSCDLSGFQRTESENGTRTHASMSEPSLKRLPAFPGRHYC